MDNPTIPVTYDLFWSIATLLMLAMTITAIVVLIRRWRMTALPVALAWLLLIVAIPAVGPVAWLAAAAWPRNPGFPERARDSVPDQTDQNMRPAAQDKSRDGE